MHVSVYHTASFGFLRGVRYSAGSSTFGRCCRYFGIRLLAVSVPLFPNGNCPGGILGCILWNSIFLHGLKLTVHASVQSDGKFRTQSGEGWSVNIRLTRHLYTAILCNQIHRPGGRGWWAGDGCDLLAVEFRLVSEVAVLFFFGQVCHVFAVLKSTEWHWLFIWMVGSAGVRCVCLLKARGHAPWYKLVIHLGAVSTE